jgi:diguanylate cyclase (GGDEF)-like protein
MANTTEHKKDNIIHSIKLSTGHLTWIVILILAYLIIMNVKVSFNLDQDAPSLQIILMISTATMLVLAGFYLARKIALSSVNKLMEYSSEKDLEIIKRRSAEENLERSNEELSKTVTALEGNITMRKQLEEQLYALSITDELTGIYNRRGFFTLAEHRLKLAKRENSGLLMLYADVDNFKIINDALGHKEGDRLLIDIANLFKETYRETDIVARLGGDEFVVFPVGRDKRDIQVVTDRLKKNIDIYNEQRDFGYKLSISIGVVPYKPESVANLDGLLAEADRSMYEQKKRKKLVLA